MYIPRYTGSRHTTIAVVVLVFIWTVYLSDWRSLEQRYPIIQYFRFSKENDTNRQKFIDIASAVQVPSFDPGPVRELCASKEWRSDLVLHCFPATGGLNNVRQQIITCVRYAIAFRAALNLPTIQHRLETEGEDVKDEYDGEIELSYLFDKEIFLERLGQACPQLKIYGPEDADHVESLKRVEGPDVGDLDKMPETWLEEHNTNIEPGLIDFKRAAGTYEICLDGERIANSIGQVLLPRKDTYRLAAAVLHELSTQHNLTIDPAQETIESAYLGIHLRTSPDATRSGWLSYEDQSSAYHHHATRYALPVIYVASGNLSSIDLFSQLVTPTPVVTKYTLLASRPAELAQLKKLNWDQQAEVDYLVLLRASKYLGMTDSNFSWGVAVARRTLGVEGTCGGPKHNGITGFKEASGNEVGTAFEDERSLIVGGPCRFRFETRTWP